MCRIVAIQPIKWNWEWTGERRLLERPLSTCRKALSIPIYIPSYLSSIMNRHCSDQSFLFLKTKQRPAQYPTPSSSPNGTPEMAKSAQHEKVNTMAILVFLILAAFPAHAQAHLRWGDFKDDGCEWFTKSDGSRECRRRKSAVLWGIPWGQSWEDTCIRTKASFDGTSYLPHRCDNTGLNIWGIFLVPIDSCEKKAVKDQCK